MDDVTNYIKYVFETVSSKDNIMYLHYSYKEFVDQYKGITDVEEQEDYYVYRFVYGRKKRSFRVKFYDLDTSLKAILVDQHVKKEFESVIYKKSGVDSDLRLSTRLYLFSKPSYN